MPNNGFNVTRKCWQGGNYDDTGNILSNWTRGDIVSTAVTSAQISQVSACSLHLPGFARTHRIRSVFILNNSVFYIKLASEGIFSAERIPMKRSFKAV